MLFRWKCVYIHIYWQRRTIVLIIIILIQMNVNNKIIIYDQQYIDSYINVYIIYMPLCHIVCFDSMLIKNLSCLSMSIFSHERLDCQVRKLFGRRSRQLRQSDGKDVLKSAAIHSKAFTHKIYIFVYLYSNNEIQTKFGEHPNPNIASQQRNDINPKTVC